MSNCKGQTNNDLIIQVDESTKGIMEEITSELSQNFIESLNSIGSLLKIIKNSAEKTNNSVNALSEKNGDVQTELSRLSDKVNSISEEQELLKGSIDEIGKKLDDIAALIEDSEKTSQANSKELKSLRNLMKRRNIL